MPKGSRSLWDKRGKAPFLVDANLLHMSAQGKVLEDPLGRARVIRLQR
jgi:argininosuccinate synthase